jgi:hypothetical protein
MVVVPSGTQPAPFPRLAPDDAPRAAAGFEALLFEQALKPLATSMGFFGDVASSAMARAIAERDSGTFHTRLVELFEAAA